MSEKNELKANIGKKVHVVFVRYGIEGRDGVVRDLKLDASGKLECVENDGIKLSNSLELFACGREGEKLLFKNEKIEIKRIYLDKEKFGESKKLIYGKNSVCQQLEFVNQYEGKKEIPDDLEDEDQIYAEYRCKLSGKLCIGNKPDEYKDNHGGPMPEVKYDSNLAKECSDFCLKR